MKQWNVVATMAVLLTLVYAATASAALLLGKIDFGVYNTAIVPVLTAWGGYLAAQLPKQP